MAESFDPEDLWEPFGAFSMMVLQGSGQIVHVKGQVALDAGREVVGIGDMRVQVEQTLSNIHTALASVGGRMADVISLTQYTTDIQAFMAASDVRRQFFPAPYPVTTTVEVTALYHPDLMVEIAAIAEIPLDRYEHPAQSRPMHVVRPIPGNGGNDRG